MKLTIKRSELSGALGVVKTAANTRGKLPILSHVSLVANKDTVTLTTTDLDMALRLHAEAVVGSEGKTTVGAHLLADIARATNSEHIELHLKGKKLHVTAGESKFELATGDHDEFPPFPRVKDPVEFNVTEKDLRAALAATAFATSTDESRFVLNGTLLEFADSELTVVTCDGRRLARQVVAADGKAKFKAIVPGKTISELLRLLKDKEDSNVEIVAGKTNIQFTFSETTVVSKLIEGEYPNYRQVIPEAKVFTTIGRADLLGCVERVNLVADAATLQLSGTSIGICSCITGDNKEKQLIGRAEDALLAPCKQEVISNLSTKYLIESLKATSADEVQFYAEPNGFVRFDVPANKWISVIASLKGK